MGETGKGRNGVAFLISSRRGEGGYTNNKTCAQPTANKKKKKNRMMMMKG